MSFLFGTQIVIWVLKKPERLKERVAVLLQADQPGRHFSAIAIWEIAIKGSLGRPDFDVEPQLVRSALLRAGFIELPVTGAHALAVRDLPVIHRDPFDRMLVAQAQSDGLTLVTADATLARYPGQVLQV
jgi:PIN domain nuclease of toxin-antitoxin system